MPKSHKVPWPRIRTLRARFGLWAAALVLLAVVILGIFVYLDVSRNLRSSLDEALRVSASLAASTTGTRGSQMTLGNSLPETNKALNSILAEGTTVRYLSAEGKLLDGFGSSRDQQPDMNGVRAARSGQPAFSEVGDEDRDGGYFIAYTLPVLHNSVVVGFVQVLHNSHSIDDALREVLGALLIGGFIVVAAGGIGAYFLARSALAPIDKITSTARSISANDLSARIHIADASEEVQQLAGTFDSMLDRLETSFARERRFVADASHELRTPLAVMETILDVTTSEPRSSAEYREALADLMDETGRMRALTEGLLASARETQPQPAKLAPVDVSMLAQDIGDALRPLAEAKSLELRVIAEPGLMVMADSDALVRALLNLVDNAIKFTNEGFVSISVSSRKDKVLIEVADTGIGIPEESQAKIFDRFCQLDSSRRSPGAGLGLSLASQIVHNHGGTLAVKSRLGQGSTFAVTLGRVERSKERAPRPRDRL